MKTRREFLSALGMFGGLALSYGLLAVQGVAFLLPRRLKPKTRLIFAGSKDDYQAGKTKSFYDLEGNQILINRTEKGIRAFNSTCPHLGCKVHWEEEKKEFFCPCHRGIFDADGMATAGPPAAAHQRLAEIPIRVDDESGVVYLEVKAPKPKATA